MNTSEFFFTCKTLLGNKDIEHSITCLNSFLKNSRQNIHLQIFEDGTLSSQNAKELQARLSSCQIIDKRERDEKINEKLKPFPKCYHYRNTVPYAQKLFDIILYDEKDTLFVDSDVLFVREFKMPEFENFPVFMKDTKNAYSFHPLEYFRINMTVPKKLNTGFFYFPIESYSLEYLEFLLSNKVIAKTMGSISWLEQTLWAFLAQLSGSVGFFDNDQISMASDNMKINKDTIAIHFVTSYRKSLPDFASKEVEGSNGATLRIETTHQSLGKYQYLLSRSSESLSRRYREFSQKYL